uniref:Uncharacterized protein n=1 Tax=Nelumbo nucifera TaxID=4432 RepID=A0A822YCL3_NELNU|nr:TPA_asm: hypothetical protein HUJ06_010715 [Nelumbo nucifera]
MEVAAGRFKSMTIKLSITAAELRYYVGEGAWSLCFHIQHYRICSKAPVHMECIDATNVVYITQQRCNGKGFNQVQVTARHEYETRSPEAPPLYSPVGTAFLRGPSLSLRTKTHDGIC